MLAPPLDACLTKRRVDELMHVGDDIDMSSSSMSRENRRLIRTGGGMRENIEKVILAK